MVNEVYLNHFKKVKTVQLLSKKLYTLSFYTLEKGSLTIIKNLSASIKHAFI